MFFAKPGQYPPCEMFTKGHFILFAITIIAIIIALKKTIHNANIKKIIKRCTIFVCIFELVIMSFKISVSGTKNINTYVPLYYCSILIYAGLCSSLGKGRIERIGNVFLATGGIIGGVIFLMFPTTTLPTYPANHFVSIYSFVFHGIMIYLGLLINITEYIKLEKKDIVNYIILVGSVCIIAHIINIIYGSNLMFITSGFPGKLGSTLYKYTGVFFAPLMLAVQCTGPFYVIFGIRTKNKKKY